MNVGNHPKDFADPIKDFCCLYYNSFVFSSRNIQILFEILF